MNTTHTGSTSWTERTRRNTRRLAIWTTAWVITMAIAVFGPEFVWQSSKLLTIAGIALNVAVGAGMIIANRDYLRGLDELQRKIQLDAMALSLGVGLVLGLAYSNLDITNVVPFDAEISHIVILMALTNLAGILLGRRKYL